MHRILAITNQKGGVGKTTTSVNLAASFAATKRRVLLIDMDPQGNATMGCGIDKRALERSTTDVLLGTSDVASAMVSVEYADFKLLPANQDLVAAEVELMGKPGCETRLRDALAPVRDQFDMVLIDCPPALNMLTVNALVAAEGVIIPMQCEYYALEGLSQLLGSVQMIQKHLNPTLHVSTILLTMYDGRTRLAQQVAEEVRSHFTSEVLDTVIPRSVRVSEAPSFGQTVIAYDGQSAGAIAYREAAVEIVSRDTTKKGS